MTNRFSKLVQSFLTNYIIGECNYSMNTKSSYSATFHLILEFIDEEKNIKPNKIEIETITKEVIVQFLDWLETKRNVSISTRNQRLACIKSFYKYVQSNEPDLFDTCSLILSIKNKKVPTKIISYFSEEEIKIIINYLNNNNELKKLTMICVLYETGARVSELINIKLSDLNLSTNASITLYGKGNYHPHSFRHTKATHLYNNGTPLLYVKEFLGHSTIISTEIYATPDSKKQREEILKNSEAINSKNRYSSNKKRKFR